MTPFPLLETSVSTYSVCRYKCGVGINLKMGIFIYVCMILHAYSKDFLKMKFKYRTGCYRTY